MSRLCLLLNRGPFPSLPFASMHLTRSFHDRENKLHTPSYLRDYEIIFSQPLWLKQSLSGHLHSSSNNMRNGAEMIRDEQQRRHTTEGNHFIYQASVNQSEHFFSFRIFYLKLPQGTFIFCWFWRPLCSNVVVFQPSEPQNRQSRIKLLRKIFPCFFLTL